MMDHFIRIAFWIAVLSVCLQAKPTPLTTPFSLELVNFKLVKDEVKCDSESTFYTPKNIERSCFTTALDCIIEEVNGTVRDECTDENRRVPDLVEMLENVKNDWKNYKLKNFSNECKQRCEEWPLAPLTEFMDDIKFMLQKIKSQ